MNEIRLQVFADRSELSRPDGEVEVFYEGPQDDRAKQRYAKINASLAEGYLVEQIRRCRDEPSSLGISRVSRQHSDLMDALVGSVSSENGRALIGLTILQLCIKSIEPAQNVRLHKGSPSRGSFSWRDGVSMRVLGKSHIIPTLREHGLLKLNADGFMMTRSLAENYPYSRVYKARIRGARVEWANIVEAL